MNCTEKEFQDKIWAVDPNYWIASWSTIPGYKFSYSDSAKDLFNAATDLKSYEAASTYVWHNGKVIKDTVGTFIPLVNTAPPIAFTIPVHGGYSYHITGGSHGSQGTEYFYRNGELVTADVSSPKCECGAHKVGSNQHSSWCEMKELA